MNKLVFYFYLFFIFNITYLHAREEYLIPFFIDCVGSGFTGVSKNTNSRNLFFNPAFINKSEGFSIIDLSFAYSKIINEIYSDPDSLKQKIMDALGGKESYGYINLSGPIFINFRIENIQFSVFHYFIDTFRVYYSDNPSPDVYADVRFNDNIGVGGGVSFPVPVYIFGSKWEEAYIGASLFVFQRVKAVNKQLGFSEISGMDNPLSFLNDKLNPGRALSFTFHTGFFYSYENLTFGVSIYNLLSFPMVYYPTQIPLMYKSNSSTEITSYFDHMPLDFAFGITYSTKRIGAISLYFAKDFKFSIEFFEITDTENYPNFFDKIRIGIETTLANIIKLRMGLFHRNMTFGIGYDIWIFKINAAYWSEKVGNNKANNLGFSLSIDL
ncbi:MAG TPA: hypothetical protein PKW55_01305 [Spirochaetota bacterium]|nr:hypothetical protein [Spirochaetota bacterium]HOM38872.1 hypothetical protein [Spirochaetota bacterium]HPQ49167.1 hypothetical protein [Spirochaetota bacterium]